ncbi:sugar ABC transporter permease [Streptomyces sp. BH-SS-21]|uniref:Sugar ABC transporter permease n=1 Tax=Streptomyces liliiviolaceus TaxID=2823109 RepID=A0A941B8R9_9ACTN|nr:sugar ABC transporter permease [Streptomyces liliiviolaceus]
MTAFLLPFFLPFVLFYLVPVGYALWQSFRAVHRTGGQYGTSYTSFGGFEQYQKVFENTEFWSSIGRIGLFGIVQVPVMLFVALVMALLLDTPLLRLKSVFRMTAFMPYAVPGVIAAIMWSYLYSPQLSPVVDLLNGIGLDPDFLGPGAVLWSAANISTWLWTGYNMLIMYSALQSIPQELYEAAKLDGASNWAVAWRIKVPIIAPSIVLTTVFSIIGTLQLYAEPAVLRQISSNISSTFTPNMLAYAVASGNNYQQAAAISVVIAVITFVLSFGFMRLTSKRAGL